MAVVDTLEILIEADRSGLETQLKAAGRNITDFVSQMNKQQVSWTQILSASISPAIIASTAALFASAITQMVSFQNTTKNLNNVASGAIADGMGNINSAVYGMQASTGASLADTASAFEAFRKANMDDATAQYATAEAAGLARAAKMELGDAVKMLVPLFNEWGITTIPQINDAMTGLANAAGKGAFTLGELVSTIEKSAELKKVTTISDMAIDIQQLSTVASKSTIADMLESMASQADSAVSPLSIFASEGLGKLSTLIKDKGLIEAFASVREQIKKFGDDAGIASQVLGVGETTIAKFSSTSVDSLKKAQIQAAETKRTFKSFGEIVAENTTETDKFKIAWNDFETSLARFVIPTALGAFGNMFDALAKTVGVVGGAFGNMMDVVANPGKKIGGLLDGLGDILGVPGGQTQQQPTPPSGGSTTFNNTYHIASPAGAEKMTGENIAHSLYQQFQGIK